MRKTTRRKFTPEFNAKVALEALKESLTMGLGDMALLILRITSIFSKRVSM